MAKEIIIVEVINGEELESDIKAFLNVDDAEDSFKEILKTKFSLSDEAIEICLEDGYFADDTHFSVIIKEVQIN